MVNGVRREIHGGHAWYWGFTEVPPARMMDGWGLDYYGEGKKRTLLHISVCFAWDVLILLCLP
jgi:hypothetical protein